MPLPTTVVFTNRYNHENVEVVFWLVIVFYSLENWRNYAKRTLPLANVQNERYSAYTDYLNLSQSVYVICHMNISIMFCSYDMSQKS